MLIRSTPHACFVILNNGLTLELFYDQTLTGLGRAQATRTERPSHPHWQVTASQGVWLLGESVVSEVSAGQA